MLVCHRDGSAQTILRAATLRQKLQIQLSTSPTHSILTPGRPVPALIERERERQQTFRDIGRETDRQTERQTDRQTDRQIDS